MLLIPLLQLFSLSLHQCVYSYWHFSLSIEGLALITNSLHILLLLLFLSSIIIQLVVLYWHGTGWWETRRNWWGNLCFSCLSNGVPYSSIYIMIPTGKWPLHQASMANRGQTRVNNYFIKRIISLIIKKCSCYLLWKTLKETGKLHIILLHQYIKFSFLFKHKSKASVQNS